MPVNTDKQCGSLYWWCLITGSIFISIFLQCLQCMYQQRWREIRWSEDEKKPFIKGDKRGHITALYSCTIQYIYLYYTIHVTKQYCIGTVPFIQATQNCPHFDRCQDQEEKREIAFMSRFQQAPPRGVTESCKRGGGSFTFTKVKHTALHCTKKNRRYILKNLFSQFSSNILNFPQPNTGLYAELALFDMPNSNRFDILSISIFSQISLSISI